MEMTLKKTKDSDLDLLIVPKKMFTRPESLVLLGDYFCLSDDKTVRFISLKNGDKGEIDIT